MKKLLSITLVLILTLTACTTPTNTTSTPLTSSDISSSQVESVLSDYASSQEALDFVKRIAPFTAYRSYSSIDCTDYTEAPWYLIHALYEEMSAVGVPDENSKNNGIKLEITKVHELLTKYFGASAVPTVYAQQSGTGIIHRETSRWKIESVELSEFSGKKAVYTVNLKYPSTDCLYVAQMHFLVLSENSETWLQLTSNTFSVKDKKEFTLEEQASALASIITANIDLSYFENDTITSKDITNTTISRFIISSAAASYYRADFIYKECFDRDFSTYFHFPKKAISKIAYEVFGREDYVFDSMNIGDFIYNEYTDEYIDPLSFGMNSPREVLEVTTLPDSTIVVKIQGVRKIQTLQFEPIKDSDSRTFLRLI